MKQVVNNEDATPATTRLIFADMSSPLLGPDAKPRSELFQSDTLHLDPAGYTLWTQTLGAILKQTLAAPAKPGSP